MHKILTAFAMIMLLVSLGPAAMASGKDGQKVNKPETKTAVFAGGCFWSMQHAFDGIDGIHGTAAGYTGGKTPNPTYVEVSKGDTGYREAVQVVFDPSKIDYERLLNIYWRNTDPFDSQGQFCDKGDNYKPTIYVRNDHQKAVAEKLKAELEKRFGKKLATEILPASIFYLAEEYHQNYATEHAFIYGMYRDGCGQDRTLTRIWGEEAGGGVFRKAR